MWASMGLLRRGTLIIWCGVSVDTRMALGGDDGGRYDTLRGGETMSRHELADDLRTDGGVGTPLSVV